MTFDTLIDFLEKRDLAIWDYLMLDTDPVSDNLRFLVLKEAGGRCGLCGISVKDRPIDVDHILPRSRGGKTVRENLQALSVAEDAVELKPVARGWRAPPTTDRY